MEEYTAMADMVAIINHLTVMAAFIMLGKIKYIGREKGGIFDYERIIQLMPPDYKNVGEKIWQI